METKKDRHYRPKDANQLAKYIMELSTGERVEKSEKVPAKTKDGHKYIIFEDLPQDQQDAWEGIIGAHTVTFFEGNKHTPYYHDYEIFYSAWVEERHVRWD